MTVSGHTPVTEDEVDRLTRAWRRERPDLDVAPMQVLSRLSRLGHHMERARRQAFAAYGLEPWEFDVLAALRRAGAPYELSPGVLLAQTLVTSGTMTARVDKLSARGLVSRRRDEQDRRAVRVRLTELGRTTVDATLERLLARERELLKDLPDEQRAELAALLRTLLLPFERSQRR